MKRQVAYPYDEPSWNRQMKSTYKIGMPIIEPNSEEIWAYFMKSGVIEGDTLEFKTTSRLLGVAPEGLEDFNIPVNRRTTVVCYDGCWHPGPDTIQKDFEESPFFARASLSGPEAAHDALEVLMKDEHFRNHFRGGYGVDGASLLERLELYRDILNRRRTRGW